MAYRDKASGVQADFVPEGEEDSVVSVESPVDRDPDSGVQRDFVPQEDAAENSAFKEDAPAAQRRALEKAVAEDAAAQKRDDVPSKFQGPAQDQLGVRVQVPEEAPVEPEPETPAEDEAFAPTEPEDDRPEDEDGNKLNKDGSVSKRQPE